MDHRPPRARRRVDRRRDRDPGARLLRAAGLRRRRPCAAHSCRGERWRNHPLHARCRVRGGRAALRDAIGRVCGGRDNAARARFASAGRAGLYLGHDRHAQELLSFARQYSAQRLRPGGAGSGDAHGPDSAALAAASHLSADRGLFHRSRSGRDHRFTRGDRGPRDRGSTPGRARTRRRRSAQAVCGAALGDRGARCAEGCVRAQAFPRAPPSLDRDPPALRNSHRPRALPLDPSSVRAVARAARLGRRAVRGRTDLAARGSGLGGAVGLGPRRDGLDLHQQPSRQGPDRQRRPGDRGRRAAHRSARHGRRGRDRAARPVGIRGLSQRRGGDRRRLHRRLPVPHRRSRLRRSRGLRSHQWARERDDRPGRRQERVPRGAREGLRREPLHQGVRGDRARGRAEGPGRARSRGGSARGLAQDRGYHSRGTHRAGAHAADIPAHHRLCDHARDTAAHPARQVSALRPCRDL